MAPGLHVLLREGHRGPVEAIEAHAPEKWAGCLQCIINFYGMPFHFIPSLLQSLCERLDYPAGR